MATYDRAFRFATSAAGSGDKDTLAETLADGEHVLVAVWDYSTTPGLGGVVFIKDGGSEVNLELVAPYTRAGNSDRAAFFFLRNAAAGSYVIRAKNLPYCGISAIVIHAKRNCWVRATSNASGAGEGTATGLNLTSPSITPAYASAGLPAVAFGLMTHNTDGSANASDSDLSADTGNGWAFPAGSDAVAHQQPDYDGASQPGAAQVKQLTATSSVTSTFGIAVATTAYLSQLAIVVDFPEVYRIMGGTEQTGWFGNENAGGADATDTVYHPTFIPANQAVVRGMTTYNYTPTDASLLSDNGGNTWELDVAEPHNALGAHDDGSPALYSCILDTDASELYFDASGVPGTDNAKYGQDEIWVIEKPDTVNGFKTATPITRSQSTVTVIDPSNGGTNPLVPTTTYGLAVGVLANRDHSDNLIPAVVSDARFVAELRHTQWDVVTDLGASPVPVYGCFHNSYTQSGPGMAAVIDDGLPIDVTITFTGPAPTSARTHMAMMFYNILGGEPVVGDTHVPPQRRIIQMKRAA